MTETMRQRYLAELSSRLSSRSRYTTEVVQELSAHLDDRGEDLLAGGAGTSRKRLTWPWTN